MVVLLDGFIMELVETVDVHVVYVLCLALCAYFAQRAFSIKSIRRAYTPTQSIEHPIKRIILIIDLIRT